MRIHILEVTWKRAHKTKVTEGVHDAIRLIDKEVLTDRIEV